MCIMHIGILKNEICISFFAHSSLGLGRLKGMKDQSSKIFWVQVQEITTFQYFDTLLAIAPV
jgi:hypothetical protein